jgi:hypothetical protein
MRFRKRFPGFVNDRAAAQRATTSVSRTVTMTPGVNAPSACRARPAGIGRVPLYKETSRECGPARRSAAHGDAAARSLTGLCPDGAAQLVRHWNAAPAHRRAHAAGLRDRFSTQPEEPLLNAVTVAEAEGARGLARDVALAAGGVEFQREPRQGEALLDVAERAPEAFCEGVGGKSASHQRREGSHLVPGMHGHGLDIFGARGRRAHRRVDGRARDRGVPGDLARPGGELQSGQPAGAGDDRVGVVLGGGHGNILRKTVRGDRRGERFDVGVRVGAADIARVWRELRERGRDDAGVVLAMIGGCDGQESLVWLPAAICQAGVACAARSNPPAPGGARSGAQRAASLDRAPAWAMAEGERARPRVRFGAGVAEKIGWCARRPFDPRNGVAAYVRNDQGDRGFAGAAGLSEASRNGKACKARRPLPGQ